MQGAAEELGRNVFRSDLVETRVDRLATYVLDAESLLNGLDAANILAGKVDFPPCPGSAESGPA